MNRHKRDDRQRMHGGSNTGCCCRERSKGRQDTCVKIVVAMMMHERHSSKQILNKKS